MKAVAALAFALLLLAVMASAIAVVWARHQGRVAFVESNRLQDQKDALNVEFGRLELEQATWAAPGRIEQIARSQLGMVTPAPDQVEMIRQ
ncbi:MAG TPA: cell division protein FtsL [Rhodanobacteraceae bacterium]|nr:cell division protein FtsL [Rhodanobacteraceae bacterium]